MLNRLFSAELKVWHLSLVLVLLAMGTGTTSAQTATSTQISANLTPTAFVPSGAFNMAAAKSNTAIQINSAQGAVEVLRTTFTVPANQVADIAVFFNAEAYKYPNGYCYLQFFIDTIGGSSLAPGQLWVVDGYVYSNAYPTISGQGYKVGLKAGTHSVLATLMTTGGDCYIGDRSLIVISNRHA